MPATVATTSNAPTMSERIRHFVLPPGVMVSSGMAGKDGDGEPLAASPGPGLVPAVGLDGVKWINTFGLAASLIVPSEPADFVRPLPQIVAVAVILIAFSCSSVGAVASDKTLMTPAAS